MSDANRPLSPHLQIYRWEVTMFLSILHRMTGVALAFGALIFTIWLMTLINGGAPFTLFYTFAKTQAGVLFAFGWLFALVFHFLNGIRHLFWDYGAGLSIRAASVSAWCVLIGSFVMTTVVWSFARGAITVPKFLI